MSDTAAPAPAPAAPVENAAPADAPKEQTTGEMADAELANLLKSKPLTYKSNGKERRIDDVATLTRHLQQLDGIEKARTEALTAREEAAKMRAELEAMKSDPLEALSKLYGDPAKAREAAEKRLWEEIQREEKLKAMDPVARQAAEERDRLAKELETYRKKEAEAKAAEEKAQQERVFSEIRETVASGVMESLQAIQAPESLAPIMVRIVSPALVEALDDGLSMEAAQAVAIEAGQKFMREVVTSHLKAGPKALEWLGEDGKGFLKALRQHDWEEYQKAQGQRFNKSKPAEEPKPSDSPRGRWDEIDKLLGR